jgi:hypothetical protein
MSACRDKKTMRTECTRIGLHNGKVRIVGLYFLGMQETFDDSQERQVTNENYACSKWHLYRMAIPHCGAPWGIHMKPCGTRIRSRGLRPEQEANHSGLFPLSQVGLHPPIDQAFVRQAISINLPPGLQRRWGDLQNGKNSTSHYLMCNLF